jgi:C4-dicarboxylate-binding protein DctP
MVMSRGVVGLTLCLWLSIATAQPIAARVHPFALQETPAGKAIETFVQQIAKRTVGRVKIESLEPAAANEVISSIQGGRSDIGIVSTYALGRFDPAYQVFSLPFVFDDLGAVSRFQQGEGGKALAQSLRARGVDTLGFVHESMSGVLADRPLKLPSDFKGKKLATLATQTPSTDLWAMLGASSAFVQPADIVPAMSRGSAEAYAGPVTLIPRQPISNRFDVFTATRHEYLGYVLIANTKFIEALPPEIRAAFYASALEARSVGNTVALERINSQVIAYRKSGGQIINLKKDEVDAWRAVSMKEWSKYDGIVGRELVQMARASGTGGGGDPCPVLQECRCRDRSCKSDCCK